MGQPSSSAPPAPPPTLGERLGLAFDAWALTDPGAKGTFQNDRSRIAELEAFWRSDTNPDETYRLYGLIVAAVKADQVATRPGEFSKYCPWIPTFVARVDAVIGTEEFKAGQLFTFKAGVDGKYFGRGFERLGFLPGTQRPKPKPQVRERVQPPKSATLAPRPARIGDQARSESIRSTTASAPGRHTSTGVPAYTRRTSGADRGVPASAAPCEPRGHRAARALWRADPDPASTLACHEELLAAVRAGKARQHGDESLRDCPWSQVYVA